MRKTADQGYAAGLLDGEGSFCIYTRDRTAERGHNRPEYRGSISIGMCDPIAVAWMKVMFGGFLSEKKAQKVTWKTQWHWKVTSGTDLLKVLDAVEPYLLVKADQAALLRAFVNFRLDRTSPTAKITTEEYARYALFYNEMRCLNARGVAA